jgi:hypothetical protein
MHVPAFSDERAGILSGFKNQLLFSRRVSRGSRELIALFSSATLLPLLPLLPLREARLFIMSATDAALA